MVRAARLETRALVSGLEAGQFYASTGVELDDIVVTPTRLAVHIRQQGNFKYSTQFIGANGRVLATDRTMAPVYRLRGGETYVRAKVVSSSGSAAWVQPVFTARYRAAAP